MAEYIYHKCSEKTKIALEHFCKTFNESNADIYIIMAQKALCLYKLLVQQGRIESKNVFSSIAIDYNKYNSDWENKKVAIVDDIIVSGSALSAAAMRLIDCGVSSNNLEIIAIARDTEYQKMSFTNLETNENIIKCAMDLPDPDCIELSYEISRLLSYYGIPYDTDYPCYQEIEIKNDEIKKIQNSPFWDLYDITNEENKKNCISSFVLFPTEILKSKFWSSLGICLDELVGLKVRIYIHKHNNDMNLTVVPMALFNEISDKDLEALFESFKINIFLDKKIGQDWSTKTKFRFIQYFLAYSLTILFSSEIGKENQFKLDLNWLGIQFGESKETVISVLSNSICKLKECKSFENFTYKKIPPNLFYNKMKKIDVFNTVDINEILLSPFKERHEKYEIPTRKDICREAKHYIQSADIIEKYSKRLREGFSFFALMEIFDKFESEYDLEKLISLFIDRSIDLGIIVPIVYHYKETDDLDAHYICRAYRHGEDLPFGEADKYRIVFFLKCLYEQFDIHSINEYPATVTFEKIIVLFIQMGLRNGSIFNRFLGFDNYPVLKERFCVHGAIATIFENECNSHIYTENEDSTWITRWLTTKKLIRQEGLYNRKHYCIDKTNVDNYLIEHNSGNLCEDIQDAIETIANIIINWYNLYQNQKDEFKKQITAITSCRDQYTFASAIVTELHYFKRYWDSNVIRCLDEFIMSDMFVNGMFRYSTIEQALKSGRNKHKWYVDNKAKEIISKVSKQLKALHNNSYIIWKQMNRNENDAKDQNMTQAINEALGYLYFYSVCYEWLANDGLFLVSKDEEVLRNSKTIQSYINDFEIISNDTPTLNVEIFDMFKEIMEINDIHERIIEFKYRIDNVLSYCDSLIQKVEEQISNKVETYSMHYKSCFIIDINANNKRDTDKIFLDIWKLLDEDENKTNLNIVRFNTTDSEYQRYGVFYTEPLSKNEIGGSYLYNVYKKVCYEINKVSYVTRIIYVPCIPNQVVLYHNTKNHISQYTESFNESFLKYILPLFETCALDQTLLVKTRNCFNETTEVFRGKYKYEKKFDKICGINIPEILDAYLFYTKDERDRLNVYDYSTGAILDSNLNVLGTGFLFFHKNKEYCITCQHVIRNISSDYVLFKLKDSTLSIKMKPINKRLNDTDNAQQEVAVLEPIEIIQKIINNSKNFSEKHCILEKHLHDQSNNFRIFGYSTNSGEYVDKLEFQGLLDDGYYALSSKKSEKNICGGFSGAGVVSYDGKLLGIHDSHDSEGTLKIIPCQVIVDELNKICKQTTEEKNHEIHTYQYR